VIASFAEENQEDLSAGLGRNVASSLEDERAFESQIHQSIPHVAARTRGKLPCLVEGYFLTKCAKAVTGATIRIDLFHAADRIFLPERLAQVHA
jgi:hypothetical protein